MRKVIFGGANSLDNFIARANGAVDWLMWSDEAAAVMADSWKTIDTIVMGRKTYELRSSTARGLMRSSWAWIAMFSRGLWKQDLAPAV